MADDPVDFADAVDVPVFVHHSSPLTPQRRPYPGAIRTACARLPADRLPPDGAYLVPTTFRQILHAAATVGRDITPWLISQPRLAAFELASRTTPLLAYLRRRRCARSGTWEVVPNEIYQSGTEVTAKGAFSYRIGMTMAEWLCSGNLGMSPSRHLETWNPAGAAVAAWKQHASKPDLVGYHPHAPSTWLIEAKAQRRLTSGTLLGGAKQLALDHLISIPHRRVLCGTSLEDRLFMTVDIDTRWPHGHFMHDDPLTWPNPESDDTALYFLTYSSMLIYLTLRSAAPQQTTIIPVGATVARRGTAQRRVQAGALTSLEADLDTREVRTRTRSGVGSNRIRNAGGIDMLTTQLPGSGVTVGLSRRLYAACEESVPLERQMAMEAERATRRGPDDSSDPELVDNERRSVYRGLAQGRRAALDASARRGFNRGGNASWEDLLDDRAMNERADPEPGWLEAASADIYLAVNERVINGGSPT